MTTISARIKDAIIDLEHQALRARLHRGSALRNYLDPKCVMLSPEYGLLSDTTQPKLSEVLDAGGFKIWGSYEIEDVHVLEVSMMVAVICYRLEAMGTDAAGRQHSVSAIMTSVWKQEASSKWKLCMHQEGPLG